jgi:citrate lyase subunit beta/citryl-CoA lyase
MTALRSLLFVPGDRPERMAKALESGADALILDLEDAVALARKPMARAAVAAFLATAARRAALFVRINALDSGLVEADLATVMPAMPDALVLPKAEGVESVRRLLAQLARPVPVLPIATETPAAVFTLGTYRAVAEHLVGLTWGAEDLPAAIGARTSREPDGRYTSPYEVVRTLALFGAHAAQVPAIETVYPSFRDLDALASYASRAARDGFTGMLAIHPAQVSILNHAFTPGNELVAEARAVIAAFAASPGAGVVERDGKMLDAPHLRHAHSVLHRAGLTD